MGIEIASPTSKSHWRKALPAALLSNLLEMLESGEQQAPYENDTRRLGIDALQARFTLHRDMDLR